MAGIPLATKEMPEVIKLYLFCSPKLDLSYRCLPRAGGVFEQDWQIIQDFKMIEQRIIEILNRTKIKK